MIESIKNIHECLIQFVKNAVEVVEYWEQLNITGNQYAELTDNLNSLLQKDIGASLTIRVNDEAIDIQTLQQLIDDEIPLYTWQVLLNKDSFLHPGEVENSLHTIWFMTKSGYSKWVSEIAPFSTKENILRQYNATRILVCDIDHSFGGPSLAIDTIDASKIPHDWPLQYEGPDEDAIKRQVHILSHGGALLSPAPFLLSWGEIDSITAQPFRLLSGETLANCLTQEFYDLERVVLKGARRLELPLTNSNDAAPNATQLQTLWEAVRWLYEERSEVRAALIADRLSLDLSNEQTLLSGVCQFAKDALIQSKEQYKFVIQDRKDVYAKELRDLLKDVQHQAGLFSEKVRSIMNSLLRDVLAALLFISIGLFSRVGKSKEVLESNEAELLFKALAVYLAISLFLQIFIHLRDLYLTKKELAYWTKTTRTQISNDDMNKYLKEPINDRRWSFYGMITLLSLIYVVLCLISWNFQFLLKVFEVL